MAFLRARLIQNVSDQKAGGKPYFSPRQKEEQRKAERNRIKSHNKTNTSGGKSARLSLQYASSSPMKHFNKNNKTSIFNQSEMGITGISPIKSAVEQKRGKSKHLKKVNKTVPSNFELSSMDDFPSMASAKNISNKK